MAKIILAKDNPFMSAKVIDYNNGKNTPALLVDGSPTLFSIYLASSQAKKWFADLIVKLDKENKFHAVKEKEIRDPNAEKEALRKYAKERELSIRAIEEWKKENADLFKIEFTIPRVATYVRNYIFPSNLITSPEDAIQGYKYANKFLKDVEWAPAATQKKRVIKDEYKEDYKEAIRLINEKIGFPGDSAIKSEVTDTILKTTTRLTLNRKPFEDTVPASIFAENFYTYLFNTNFSIGDEKEEEE